MRFRPALVCIAALPLAATALAAQGRRPVWHMVNGPNTIDVSESSSRGYPALPVSALVSVGGEIGYAHDTAVVHLGDTELRFASGSSDVLVSGRPSALSHAVYDEGGVVFVPAEFFTRELQVASAGRLQVAAADRVVRTVDAPDPALAAAPLPAPTQAGAAPEPVAAPARTVADARPMRRLVVVDAGHGGVDPGAHGPNGTREKDVTLRVARLLAEELRRDPTLEVRMTRTADTLIGLYDRPRMANAWRHEGQPAVFISIHCNANPSRDEKGYETYFLSEARTADARRVETFENSAAQYDDRAAAGDAMGFILTDLRQNHYLRESSEWAQMIQDELHQVHPGPDRGVKQAGFAVLRGSFMPAVLVEIGFISNAREEQLLLDERMEESIARQLAEGVKAYFDRPAVRPATD